MPKRNKIPATTSFQMCCFISLLIGIQGLVMAFICLLDSNFTMVLVSISYAFLMLFTLVVLLVSKNPFCFYVTGTIMIILIECYFLYSGGSAGFGIIWIAIVPLFTLYLFPLGKFLFLNLVVFFILFAGLLTPLNKYIYEFSDVFRVRFTLLYFLEVFFSFFLKNKIQHTEDELNFQKNILSSEISQAAAIQTTFLKKDNLEFTDWDTAFSCIPMAGVSGDLFDYFVSADNSSDLKGIGIYDISGHGVSSGIISLLAKNIIHHEFLENLDLPLWETVQKISDRFIEEKGEITNYITGITVRTTGTKVEMVNAGHLLPFIYRKAENEIYSVPNSSKAYGAIGLTSLPSFYDSVFLEMEAGDELILFTDGIPDAKNPMQLSLGRDGFQDLLARHVKTQNIGLQLREIVYEISKFMDNTQSVDDMTIILLRKK